MPEVDGYELCKKLKSNIETFKIPVIFISAKTDSEDQEKGFLLGAVDYITKPFSVSVVLRRIETHLNLANKQRLAEIEILKKTKELRLTQNAAVSMLGEAGHYNDTDTGIHIWRMAAYTRLLAENIGWEVVEAELLELAAPLHDTGKIGITDGILKAPRKLTSEEWETMKTHTEIGFSILSKSNTRLFKLAAEIALYHHEKWDGSGYPKGLKEKNIPESARIIAIADVFDALTMKRPYKEAWTVQAAFEEIQKGKNKHFDPEFVDIFLDLEDDVLEIKEKFELKENDINMKKFL